MCIAIHRPGGVHIKKQTLINCFESNPHGAGFVYPNGDGLQIVKGLMTFTQFWKAYRAFPGKPMLIHFRWATHGTMGPENTHPFGIEIEGKTEYAVIHNGIINDAFLGTDVNKSDTALFTEKVCAPLLTAMVGRPMPVDVLAKLLKDFVGYSNKVLIMDRTGKVCIVNETSGTKDLGCWFSNSQYKTMVTRTRSRRIHFETQEEWDQYQEEQRNSYTRSGAGFAGGYSQSNLPGTVVHRGGMHQSYSGYQNSVTRPITYHGVVPGGVTSLELSPDAALWMRARFEAMYARKEFDHDDSLVQAGLSVVALKKYVDELPLNEYSNFMSGEAELNGLTGREDIDAVA